MNTKQRTVMIFVLLLSLATSSCAPGQLFGPTVTPTPTSTSTPTPLPTSTLTLTPMPTNTPMPTDTPTSIPDWNGIPIMPGATNGQDLGGSLLHGLGGTILTTERYQFTTTASETDIVTYYEQKMAKLGWVATPELMTAVLVWRSHLKRGERQLCLSQSSLKAVITRYLFL